MRKLRFALLVGLLATAVSTWGQDAPVEKMSIATQMFLDEMNGKLIFDEATSVRFNSPQQPRLLKAVERPFVTPDTIDGKAYIAAFVRIADNSQIAVLQRHGVIVETVFDDGVLTTLIPVDELLDVASLQGVKRIEVSTVMQESTDLARRDTNVDDLLAYSADAVTAGLPHGYDGTGVIVGVIDRGIDYNHIAFKDKNGETRIKRAYVYNGSKTIEYDGTGELPNDGVTNTDHGTHTSSIAGGSSVMVTNDTVTVTDDHENATYGGMAPGADLFLCGINGMGTTRIANAFRRICNYADEQGKPVVVSNSYGESIYNRDGGGLQAEVVSQLFGEDHPNRICLFATGNNAGHSGDAPGGIYVSGPATAESPLGTVICSTTEAIEAGWQYYRGEYIADAFTRATDATGIAVTIYVLDATTGAVVDSLSYTTADGNQTLTLGDYFSGYGASATDSRAQVRIYFDYMTANNRKQVVLYTPYGLISPVHTLAIEVYPIGGSSDIIDMWSCGNYTFFDNHLTTDGHSWTVGTDDMSVFANACYPDAISVGSYVTRPNAESNPLGDISIYSSYAVEGMGPLGTMHPWIAAPGEDIIAAFNHNVNRGGDYSDVVVNDPNNLYGLMSGTSMATPMAAGIVALWMQAAAECGKQLSLSEVKEIMRETAIKDSWVIDGAPHGSHFGNGKIDALAGVEYILREYGGHNYELGDVNHDEQISITDVTALITFLLGVDNGICLDCADVDGNERISIGDVTALIGRLLTSGR